MSPDSAPRAWHLEALLAGAALAGVVLATALCPGLAAAQAPAVADSGDAGRDTVPGHAPADPPAYRAEDLTVTVTRSPRLLERAPYAVTVVDAGHEEAMERRTTLARSLRTVPGVQVADRRNFSLGDRVVLRGVGSRAQFGVRGIKVLMDGIPLTLPDGQATLSNLDLGSAGRIEVLRGPASALYGNASGGVIRVRSGGFTDRPAAVRTRVTAGQDGFLSEELEAAGRMGGWRWLAHARHLETDGWRRHSAAETWSANVVARRGLDDGGELRAVLNVFDMPFGQNPSSLPREEAFTNPRHARDFIVAQGAGESATQAQGGATLRLPMGEDGELRASGWLLGRDLRNPIPGRIIELDRLAGGLRLETGEEAGEGPALGWTAGLDAELQRDDRRESENLGIGSDGGSARAGPVLLDQRETVAFAAPFLRLQARLTPSLTLSSAVRLDAYRFRAEDRLLDDGDDSGERTMTRVSPSLGLTWSPGAAGTVYANLGTAFETPTTSELSNRPDGAGGLHPDLGPQDSRSLELGGRLSPIAPLRLEAALYDMQVVEALVPSEGPGGQVFFRNAGRLSRRGVEVRAAWRFLPHWEAVLAYAFQDYRYDAFPTPEGDFSGNDEPGVPPHRVDAGLEGDLPSGIRAEVEFTWVDAFPVDDGNTASDVSRRVLDLRLGWEGRIGGWELEPFVGLDNVLDERYNASVVPNAFGGNYYEPAPGRRAFGGVEVGLPGF